ncbi:MAG TPA: tetratricopeptide repeat protein [Pyrinomonadaceae bacterium]|nr:tetratricopeptide repeat protein [Pyrinomonadaceae bacterium]
MVICAAQVICTAQTGTTLPPPKPTLIAVHLPDLSQLEKQVGEQLTSLQDSLRKVINNPRSTDEQLSWAYGQLGQIYHAYSLNLPARECYVNAHRLAPNEFRWIYLVAKLDHQEGRATEAIEGYRTAATLLPKYVAAHVNLGSIYLELNRLKEAQMSFGAALKVQENIPAAHYGLGQIALSQRNFTEAINYFQRALALAPEANRIHYALAMAYRGLNDHESARRHLTQQGTVGVRVSDPLIEGVQELVKGERVHMIRGRLALEAKRFAEGAAEFRKAVAANPNSVPALVNLGAALTQTGDLKEAAEQFQQALRADPNNVVAHYNLAVLLANAKQHQPALVHLEAVFKINPSDRGARFLLAQLLATSPHLELRNGARALKLAQELYESNRSVENGELVALALAELGRCSEAAEWQKKLISAAEQQRLSQVDTRSLSGVEQRRLAAAEQQRQAEVITRLRADLERYQKGPPCRP